MKTVFKSQVQNSRQWINHKLQLAICLWWAGIFIPFIIIAGEINFTATVDRTTVGLGETFTLNVSVNGENISGVPAPKLPDLPDFNILGRSSSQSTSISFINGRMSQQTTITFIYTLSPKKIGKFTIGPCRIDYQGKTYETQPIEIEVVKTATQATPSPSPAPPRPSAYSEGGVMLIAVPNKKEAYVGEQINVEFYLYTQYNLDVNGISKMPNFSGFWYETIYDPDHLLYQKKTYNGKLYYVALIKTVALFPVTSGNLTIDPMELSVTVVKPPRDFFDIFGTAENLNIASKPISINVLPLPQENKPEDFCGGVGRFSLDAKVDRDTSKQGEPVNLIVRLSGTGNIKLIEKPVIPQIPNLKILEPEVKENIDKSTGKLKGTKEFRFPLIPQADGEYLIPEITVSYFDPAKKTYERLHSEKLRFIATGVIQVKIPVDAGGFKILGSDIRYIKPNKDRLKKNTNDFIKFLFLFYPFSIILIITAFLYQRHQVKLSKDRAYARRFMSGKVFKRRFQEASEYLKKKDQKNFYSSLSKAILGYIGDRFNLDTGALTIEQLKQELLKRQLDPEHLDQIFDIIRKCDTYAYSPLTDTDSSMEDLFKRTKKLMEGL
uniref:Protein BatD n=1 Tax=candidate division WOR-3 bacterium TaxID=2052148 RepID=A0A7V3RGZ4_UNCW3